MASQSSKTLVNLIGGGTNFQFSFEVTPDVNKEQIDNLEEDPTFFAVTWHAKSHQCKDLDIAPLKIANYLKSKGKQVLMHLSCDMLKQDYLIKLLAYLQENGICNLFLMLGESYDSKTSDFKNTVELLKFIRATTGNYFCVGVTGFCNCSEETLLYLKVKIDAGADFIITQAFFEAVVFKTYKQRCTQIDINVPIVPGVFAFENHTQLTKFGSMCGVNVPKELLESPTVGIEVMKKMIQTIRSDYAAANFHFFTLNKLQNVCNLIKEIKEL